MYYIGANTQYIAIDNNGRLYATTNLDEARMHSSKQKAINALVTLPRKFYEISSLWEVKECQKKNMMGKIINQDEEDSNVKENYADNIDDNDYITLLENIARLKESKSGCLTYLNGKLSKICEKIIDIEHYIELNNLSASNAYYAYKMLHDALQERRKIKDRIICAKALYDNCNVDKIAECKDRLNNRTYNPRQLTELFGDVEKK